MYREIDKLFYLSFLIMSRTPFVKGGNPLGGTKESLGPS